MVLNQETGNTSAADKQRADILFEQTGVAHYLDKADYSTAMKDILDEYNKSGSWDSYLSMDNWQQSIKDYTSVPVYFNRDISSIYNTWFRVIHAIIFKAVLLRNRTKNSICRFETKERKRTVLYGR